MSSADAQKKGLGVQFYQGYSTTIGQKLTAGLKAKSGWVTASPASDKYAAACAFELFQATVAYIAALNKIDNTDCSGKQRGPGAGDDDTPDDQSGVDFVTFVKAINLLDDLGTVDEDETQAAGGDAPASI